MQDPYFFGYGSLVNRATHLYTSAYRATLPGWRRIWRHTALRPVAFLTAIPDGNGEIDGLMAPVPGADWAALDEREHAYDRVPAHGLRHPVPDPVEAVVYTIPEGKHEKPDAAHPILLSYLDVVVQGYLTEFGEDGVERFFRTTGGWDAPILNDRAEPIYPRHQTLSAPERELVDYWLGEVKAVAHG
ncbi:gamma-glutamylcyclotransferase [Tranquillimonas alkanivorans]|uniref:Gamma-glutamyl cyclotransferase, AIG2-like n=1 Tax=Tranquillimonas alkanivorans TaxID=441119 RepID=A0A1I5T1U6_9RHOB|nr:gamma-glutamylcyclotransferase [Tranquillimonas alkanivorans]SFP77019.1 Gamma-glutamyl cyclotransferase, AIG2-like [Tranquillimonas alkanivorans]